MSAKITIVTNPRSGLEIHKAGCADLSKPAKRGMHQWTEADLGTVRDVVISVYADHMNDDGDTECNGWKSYLSEFAFFPCCPKLN